MPAMDALGVIAGAFASMIATPKELLRFSDHSVSHAISHAPAMPSKALRHRKPHWSNAIAPLAGSERRLAQGPMERFSSCVQNFPRAIRSRSQHDEVLVPSLSTALPWRIV